ncbi:hypothetical protein QVD17_08390 [Tagetes erecta]|uniref:Transposase-associated domain-containing protein n=1 Tax=Tagetes erecta TaxID=13708 RepID=A0AAD8P487_TARER|nr:hypothetical protein QVD17_08390 [Tagetes erecta]
MATDKSWLTKSRNSPEYEQGLKSFIEMCKEQVDNKGNVRCACAKCRNSILIPFTKMKFHMYSFGFCQTYTTWEYHGESLIPRVVDDVVLINDMDDVIEDIMREHMEEDTNTSSSNSQLFIEFSQYFQNTHAYVNEGETTAEVVPPTVTVNEVSEGESDYDDDDSDYDTNSSERCTEEMADVMARGHGGDGAEDPPPPNGDGRVFDRSATYTPVGEVMDLYGREASIYMWWSIPFDKHSWSNVSSAMRNALREHMKERFDLDAIEKDPDCSKLESGICGIFMKKYRTRKNEAKQRFTKLGGKEKAYEAKENPPVGMNAENWRKAVDFFMTEEHEKCSTAKKAVRKKQKYVNRGGTSSYSSTCYKKVISLDQFHDAHTDKDGKFDSELAESLYKDLKKEYECQNEALGEEGSSSQLHPRDVQIFEKVMGSRRGHVRGIGPKPSSASPSAFTREKEQESPPALTQFLASYKAPHGDDEDDTNELGGNDDLN